jgi:hypothetical protein
MRGSQFALVVFAAGAALAGACGSDDDKGGGSGGNGGTGGGSPDNVGSVCKVATDCFPKVDAAALLGEVQCLDRTDEGYCTHLCVSDADCCAVEGECKSGLKQVCAPFESTGKKMCFLSCESADLGGADADQHCRDNVSPDFGCRSTGGGKENRKVCFPNDCGVGETCAGDAECATGLTCLTSFKGGYCGKKDCAVNADCPTGSLCVKNGSSSYCALSCAAPGDCAVCRGTADAAACKADATFMQAGTTGSVCVPSAK